MDNKGRVCVKVEKDIGIPAVLDRLKERTDSKNAICSKNDHKKIGSRELVACIYSLSNVDMRKD